MRTITMAGNITRDPELHKVAGGKSVARFAVAENRRWTDGTGAAQESVTYLDIVVSGPMAAHVATSLRGGPRTCHRQPGAKLLGGP